MCVGALVGSRAEDTTAQTSCRWLCVDGVAGMSERDAGLIQHGDHAPLSL